MSAENNEDTSNNSEITQELIKSFLDLRVDDNNFRASISITDFREFNIDENNIDNAVKLTLEYIEERRMKNVDADVIKIMYSQKIPRKSYIVVMGKLPVDGTNAEVKYNFIVDQSHPIYKEDDIGNVDFHETSLISNVKEGDLIAEVIRETEGEPGYDVFGKLFKQKSGKPAKLKAGKNVVISDDSQKIWAKKSGRAYLNSGKVCVEEIFIVSGDLDYSIGNINFTGDVIVKGNVPEGFKIESEGNIKIQGSVEHSNLHAQGNVEIGANVTGWHDTAVRANKDVIINFMENANIIAGNNVVVGNYSLNSNIDAKNQIIFKSKNPKCLVGGHIKACRGIETIYAGNPISNVKTFLELYVDDNILKEMQEIRQKVETEEDKNVRNELKEYMQQLNDRIAEIKKSSIKITGQIFPGVVINMFGKTYNVNTELIRVAFYYDELLKKIEIRDIA